MGKIKRDIFGHGELKGKWENVKQNKNPGLGFRREKSRCTKW